MVYKIAYDLGPANEHAKWAFGRIRFLSYLLREDMRKNDLWEDFIQSLYTCAFNAWQQKMGIQETRRYASRQMRAFLKQYGYKAYRNSYVRMEACFSAVYTGWQQDNLPESRPSRRNLMPRSLASDPLTQERILKILSQKPQGISRRGLIAQLRISVTELQWHLDNLQREQRIVRVTRELQLGRVSTLIFMAGDRIPEQKVVKGEIYENIRRAYFEQGKSTPQIAREYHHSQTTICQAIHSDPRYAASAATRKTRAVRR